MLLLPAGIDLNTFLCSPCALHVRSCTQCSDSTVVPLWCRAFDWGAAHNIGIVISLHADPGSQNGFEHSSPFQLGQQLWDASSQPAVNYLKQTLNFAEVS